MKCQLRKNFALFYIKQLINLAYDSKLQTFPIISPLIAISLASVLFTSLKSTFNLSTPALINTFIYFIQLRPQIAYLQLILSYQWDLHMKSKTLYINTT